MQQPITLDPQPFRVLIVEDDPMVGSVNQRFCARVPGFAVVGVAQTAARAEALLAYEAPDLVLLDIYMPEGSGLALLETIRRQHPSVDVIMLTAAQDPGTIARALRLGVVDYLVKPYDFERFAEALQRYALFHSLLHGGAIDQARLDRVRFAGVAEETDPPKGIDNHTLLLVTEALGRGVQPQSVEELATIAGVSRITALRYLRHLEHQGDVAVDLQYGAIGRPRRLYRLRK